jgi:hypothetical protein
VGFLRPRPRRILGIALGVCAAAHTKRHPLCLALALPAACCPVPSCLSPMFAVILWFAVSLIASATSCLPSLLAWASLDIYSLCSCNSCSPSGDSKSFMVDWFKQTATSIPPLSLHEGKIKQVFGILGTPAPSDIVPSSKHGSPAPKSNCGRFTPSIDLLRASDVTLRSSSNTSWLCVPPAKALSGSALQMAC